MKTKTLTVKQKPADKAVYLYRIYCGRKTVGAIVLPTFRGQFGIVPTDDEVRSAVSECSPSIGDVSGAVVKRVDET